MAFSSKQWFNWHEMRAVGLIFLGLVAFATATPTIDDVTDNKMRITSDIKSRQIMILKLLNHVLQPVMYKEIEDVGRNFKIEDCDDCYIKVDVHKRFVNMMKTGFLPRGEIFTLHVERQLNEVVSAFHLLYYAKDFDTFIKTACWMRLHLNEGMFVYALTVACRHREDCKGIILPAPYEIYPFYFLRADVIQKAYLIKMKKGLLDRKLCDFYGIKKTDKDVYVIDENVFDTRVYLNKDDRLRYFTEDIDLNTYYYYFHVDYPFWMKHELLDKFKFRRFEMTVYFYQQILARYYLERLSNGLGEIKTLTFEKPIKRGYWPWMKLHNGVELPMRTNNYVVLRDDNVDILRLVEAYEVIIKEAILKGHITIDGINLQLTKPEDIERLGRIIYGKIEKDDVDRSMDKMRIDAYRYLLIIMKACLGLNTMKSDKYFVVPTVLDHYTTALRDPVFYKLQKRLIDFVLLFKKRLPSYTVEDLHFPGVRLEKVVVDKLVTYFDDFLMDMTNAVMLSDEELKKTRSDMTILVRKRRLNHQPFKVSMDIVSDKAVDCVVRMFLGPKVDHLGRLIDINRNRMNFVELDSFVYKLNTGKNTIVRDSLNMHNLVRDRIMTRDLWKKIEGMSDVKELLVKDLKNWQTGFPARLLLPKGRVGGLKMMLYVIVTPLRMVENIDRKLVDMDCKDCCRYCRSTVLLDKMPLGFPFDRHIDTTKFFTHNMRFVDVMIFHKKMVCDMKTRWDKYVLRDYNMVDRMTMVDETYNVDTEIDNRRFRDDMTDF